MKRFSISAVVILLAAVLCSGAQTKKNDIILDNTGFRLVISSDAVAKSLKIKSTGEEMLKKGQNIPIFTVTQERPFDNEVKLENPAMAPTVKGCRVLTFGGEAFSYESFTTEWPYKFCGVKRCHYNTYPVRHPAGEIGGVLDVSEFGASSIYLDQNSDLQDEIAEKIAAIYDCGFEFVYLDGSEGVGPPCGINVALSQYRVVSKFKTLPVFVEGAAKSHFSWHFQAGANAFDVFPPRVFEEMILKYPYREAKRMQKDFTRVDFGWWGIFPDTTPAMWDFAESKAIEYNCPVTVQMDLDRLKKNPHSEDLLEVLKKWEDYRRAVP